MPHAVEPAWRWRVGGHQSAQQTVTLGMALVLSAATVNLLITGRLGLLFDLCFILTCVVLALRIRDTDLFTVGVLPPLLMVGSVIIAALNDPASVARAGDGFIQALVSGLAHHAIALGIAYFASVGLLVYRARSAELV